MAYGRLRVSTAFDRLCTIQRQGVAIGINVPCMVENITGTVSQLGSTDVQVGAYMVSLPVNWTLLEGDYIIEGGATYEVGEKSKAVSYSTCTRASCVLVKVTA